MNNQITESNYEGYKRLYTHKKDLPHLVGLFTLLDLLIFISLIPIIVETTLISAVIFGLSSQMLFLFATGTIMSDYNQKTKLIKQIYPYIDTKLNNHKLKKMLNEYRMSSKEQEKGIDGNIEYYCEDEDEIINEEASNSSSINKNFYKEPIERVKVKVKALTRNRRL